MYNSRMTALRRRATPALKSAGKFILISAVTYGPGGLAGRAAKSVAPPPLRLLLVAHLEPVLRTPFHRPSLRLLLFVAAKTV